jgi:hypothetical protein
MTTSAPPSPRAGPRQVTGPRNTPASSIRWPAHASAVASTIAGRTARIDTSEALHRARIACSRTKTATHGERR